MGRQLTKSKYLIVFFTVLNGIIFSFNSAYAVTSPNLNYSTPNVYTVGTPVTLTPTNSGGAATSCTIMTGSLPAGLSLAANGVISGTPTAVFSTTSITIKATNAGGNRTSAAFTITVYPSLPTGTNGASCTSGNVSLTASGSLPAGGTYNWYAAAAGGVSLATGATYSPTVSTTTTYYVDYTQGGLTSQTRTAVTATINPSVSSPLSGAIFSYPLNGNANDVSGNGDNGTLQGAPTATTDRYSNANSAYTFNGSSQYISTATFSASPGPQNFSISVWFKTTTAGGMLVGYGSSQTGASSEYDRHIYMNSSGQIYYGIYPNAVKTINTAGTYIDGNWHHVVTTTSTTNGSNLYVDGTLQATDATMTTSQVFGVNGYWRVAYDNLAGWTSAPANYYFTGSLDDISVYNRELTATEVANANNLNLIGGTAAACAGSSITLNAPTITGATYTWQDSGGTTVTGQYATFASAVAGNYTLTVTGGAGGCSSTATITPTISAAPSATFTATSSISVGGTATVTYTGTDPSTSTYAWTFTGGTPSTGTGQGPFSVVYSSPGLYTVSLTVTNSGGCSATSTQTVNAGYSTYAFSDNITLNTTSLGITSNLTNFPALLSIQDNNLIISGTCADKVYYPTGPAYDFAFYDPATASELNYQVESYNQATGTLLVWVKIPTLTYATNKSITFLYGSKTAIATHTTAFYQSTWASDYQAVYHFTETTYTGTTTDGTANGHTGTANGMSATNLVAGKIGNAYSFNGTSNSISNSAVNIAGTFTLSAWVKLAAINIDQKIMTNQGAAGSSTGGYKLGVYTNNIPETESPTIDRGATPTAPALATGTWHYIQGVYNGSSVSTYVDGTQYAVTSTTTGPTSALTYYIGVGEGGSQYYFNGIIDEPRVSNVAKTSDWIKAEYGDQNSPTTFTTVGSTSVIASNAANCPGALTYTWTGATSTDPTVATNWNNTTAGTSSQLPSFTGNTTLVIPSGLTNYPSLTANESIYGLTIASGASLNLNGFTLSVGCNIYNSSTGQILYGASNTSGLTWNGSAATQTYTGTNTSNTAQLGAMTINNSAGGTVTISGGPVDIYNTLTLTKGNLVVGASPAALTLKSTATQTASVAAITSGYSISGTVNVERYITGGAGYRGYRLISSPVYTATVSSNNVFSINYLQNSIWLTGAAGGGFDKTSNPTLYLYREDQIPLNTTFTNGNFWGISAINNAPTYNYSVTGAGAPGNFYLPVGNGVMMFFRGNKASAAVGVETLTSYTTPVTVTTTTSGTLNQGQVIVHDWYTPASANLGYTVTTVGAKNNSAVRGFNLVGNPYASSIDWEQYNTTTTTTGIYANNVGTTIYELNPATNNYDTYQKGGVYTNHGTRTIASGQGFFVLAANSTSPQLIFNETAKTATQNTGLNLLMAARVNHGNLNNTNPAPDQHLRLQMALDSINTDDVYIGFNSAASSQFVDDEDAPYKGGNGKVKMASFSSDNVKLAINKMPLPGLTPVTVPLFVTANAYGVYKINMTELEAIPQLYEVWLMDSFNKDSLDMRHNTTYAFNITTDTASYGNNRFQLVIRQNPALGLHLLNFTATKASGGAQVAWATENEQNYTSFTVERSTDNGATFDVLGAIASSALGSYSYLDKNPASGANLYRLKLVDLNGTVTYSAIVTVMYNNATNNLVKNSVTIYPNPAKSDLNLTITPPFASTTNTTGGPANNPGGTSTVYGIRIVNMLGTIVQSAETTGLTWKTDVSNLLPGTYILQVVNSYNNSLIGKGTFVKL